MAGKRKVTHWAVRRKNKQARAAAGDGDGERETQEQSSNAPRPDRRDGFPETIHAGSYASARARMQPLPEPVPASPFTKRRYGIWLAFCGKNYSGMQM